MIIDFHTHFFPDKIAKDAIEKVSTISNGIIKPHTNGTLTSLVNSSQEVGVNYSVTLPVATKIEQVRSINSNLPINNSNIIPFGALNPYMAIKDVEQEIDNLLSLGIKGVKLHPEYQDFYINNSQFEEFFNLLQESKLLVLFHAGFDPGPFSSDHAKPEDFVQLIERFPKLQIVAAHLGGLMMWDRVYNYLAGKNLYFDTAAIVGTISEDEFVNIVRKHGAERILFGSDSPWEDQKVALDFILNSSLRSVEKEMIIGKNGWELVHNG